MSEEGWAEYYGHTPKRIDMDRGVMWRTVNSGGGRVLMYKDMPGMFLDAMGNEVDDEMARGAGFLVDEIRKEARVQRKMNEATRKIRQDADAAEVAIRSEIETSENPFASNVPETAVDSVAPVEVTEATNAGQPRGTESYKMIHFGAGVWNVIERESGNIVIEKVSQDQAIAGMFEAELSLSKGTPEAA